MLSLFNLFQNISILINHKADELDGTLKYPPEGYNMTENSLFLDIGSGFGKPVFHAALQVGCESKGIEVVPARVEFCMDFFYEFIQDKPFFDDIGVSKLLTHGSNGKQSSQMDGVELMNTIQLSTLNTKYYEDVVHEKSDIYIELRINQNLIQEDSFIRMLSPRVNKSVLSDTVYPKYEEYFINDVINVPLTPADDHIVGILHKLIMMVVNSEHIEREILTVILKGLKCVNFCDLITQVDNPYMLDLLSDVNTLFLGSPKQTFQQILKESLEIKKSESPNKSIGNTSSNKTKDLYKELVKFLESKEKVLAGTDEILLKELLTGLKFKLSDNWYKRVSFVADDATKPKVYANDLGIHYTHIYAYNKLMSKECRKKIAKVLNKTNFRVLAWYSNPKQTIKAGLKDFTLVAKFPMQSTSTEKFHVYVYIKTK
jgi:hypothetical protein